MGAAPAASLLERSDVMDELDGMLAGLLRARGRVVLVSGEAGIGKSALVRAFTERHRADASCLLGVCDPLLTPRALGPLHDIARMAGGGLAQLLAAGAPRDASSIRARAAARWSWWRTRTGPTRRPLTCWSSWDVAWRGSG